MGNQINRLNSSTGLLVKHGSPVSFSFENETYTGLSGDTIASALAANGVWLLSRSFKYHRPRGLMSMAGLEANTLVQLEYEPNVAAERRKISHNLKVTGQNYSGSLKHDKDSKMSRFSRFMPVGFYYKAFYWPKGIWQRLWEPIVRKRTGLGCVNFDAPHSYHDKSYKFCDIAIIGSGVTGMHAAITAADAGAEVLLIEQETILGGSLNFTRIEVDRNSLVNQRNELVEKIEKHPNIEVMTNAVCNGWFADNWLPIIQENRLFKLRAKELILATGTMQQPAIFHNNDLPGILLGSAAQRLIRLYGVRPGQRAVILTSSDEGYAVALDLLENDVEVAAIADLRDSQSTTAMSEKARSNKISIHNNYTVYAANYNKTNQHISGVELAKIIGQGKCEVETLHYDCDLLCICIGNTPTYQLALQAGGKISYNDETSMFSITEIPEIVHLAGSVQGITNLASKIESGIQTAVSASKKLGLDVSNLSKIVSNQSTAQPSPNHAWPIFSHPDGKEFVDFDEDLQIADIVNACKDGYSELELVKRYSTVGMGPSQGRHSALATARIVAQQTQRQVADVGVTTARPPYRAEKLAVIAGRSFEPERFTAMHHRHIEAGAQMITAGLWWRPAYYGNPEDHDQCINNENSAIRNNVGLIDVSTLGGLEVRGPDAAELLNRMYTFAYVKQKVGTSRYLLMTNPAGTVIDDGVACRFSENHFYVTATTGGVDNVYRTMLWWNAQWRLDVDITNVTAAYAGINIAGPNARKVLQNIVDDIDLSAQAFPYLAVREGSVANIPARLLRVGFVGELGYEIHVASRYGEALWDALINAGKEHNISRVGIEAQRLLRLEKGHIIVGQDTDAMTTPQEVNMTWAIASKKPFFVGGRSLEIIDKHPSNRKLVGFEVTDNLSEAIKESNLILDENKIVGHITSVCHSPSLNKTIGMAYASSHANPGSSINIKLTSGKVINAQVVEMPFYDPKNTRQEL